MALSPLIVQRPSVSLIGGKELPKASGEGVRVADISNSFAQLEATLLAQQDEGNALDDKLKAEHDAEIYHDSLVGKSPADRYTRAPVVSGSVPYRAAATVALERDAMSDIRSIYSEQAGAIQVEVDTPTDQKLLRIHNAADAILSNIAPGYRQQAREYIQADIAQREAQLRGEDANRLEKAIDDGQTRRLNAAYDKGVQAASTGADWSVHTREMRAVIDERVAQGKILPADAAIQKQQLTNLVVAEGIHRTISSEAMKGNIGPADLMQMGVAMDSGAPFDLYADRPYAPGAGGDVDRFDTGQSKKDPSRLKITSADQYKQLIQDPQSAKAIANNIQELARYLSTNMKANEKDMQLWDFIEKSGLNPSRKLPKALETTFNEKIDELIRSPKNALASAEGRDYLKALVKATNTMPNELMSQLKAMTQGTFQEAMTALNFYNELTTTVNGDVQQGKIIQQSIDSGDAALFDSAITFAADVIRRNSGNDKAAEEQWRRGMLELAKPENNIDYFAGQYRDRTRAAGQEKSLETAIADAFRAHYGRLSVDPSIMKEAKEAYRNSMILSGDVDVTVALDTVMERIFNRYSASPIFYRGIAPSEPLENPDIDGYRAPKVTSPSTWFGAPVDPNLWTSDFVTGQLHNFVDSGQVAMSPEGLRALNNALVVTDAVPLGKTIFLEPADGDRARTQFKVLISVENGASTETVMVTGEDGRPTPLLLDPGLILSNINSRTNISREIDENESAYRQQRNRDIVEQYGKTSTGAPGEPSRTDIIKDPAAFDKWFVQQDSAFQKYLNDNDLKHQDVLKKQWDRYNELQKTVVPEGMKVDPKLLGTPKAVGKGVVLGAVQTIEKLFPDGQGGQFMVNVAAAETNFGEAEHTFRTTGDRGIWQMREIALLEMQRRAAMPGDPIATAAAKAKSALGIDVANLTTSDFDKPLVSALLSRMYFMRSQAPIPSDPQAQAEYWRANYNPRADDSYIRHFVAMANSVLVTPAYASTGLEANGPGMVTDAGGNAYPANFTATLPATQTSLLALSAAFGRPLVVTEHGGKNRRPDRPGSQHPRGTATDISTKGWSDADKTRFIALAIQRGYRGIGGYSWGVHIDLRNTGRHGGLGLWWATGDWTGGADWYVEGVKQGAALKGLDLG